MVSKPCYSITVLFGKAYNKENDFEYLPIFMATDKTYQQKLSWLKSHGYKFKAKKPAVSTVNRYYSVFRRYGVDIPIEYASGNVRRIPKKIERQKSFTTPKGKITAEQFKKSEGYQRIQIKAEDKKTKEEIIQKLPYRFQGRQIFNHYYSWVKHVRDEFTYSIRPPIVATNSKASIDHAKKQFQTEVYPEIADLVDNLIKYRGSIYRDHDFGALLYYDTFQMVTASGEHNPKGYIRVGWTAVEHKERFLKGVLEAVERALLVLSSASASAKSYLKITRIDIYVSTKTRATKTDLMRVDKWRGV